MDAQEEYWHETNPAVFFITTLQDLNQPYSCEQWGNQGVQGFPLIVEDPGTMFTWLHDSWSAFPTYAILDHTMTVRAKPWPYQNNGNSNSCDGNNNTIDGWNGGNANDFIAQLIDECGIMCEPCDQNDPIDDDGDGVGNDCDVCEGLDDTIDIDEDNIPDCIDECPNDPDNDIDDDEICGDIDLCPNDEDNDIDGDGICGDVDLFPECHNQAGDIDDNLVINIQDIIILIDIILDNVDTTNGCVIKDADINEDRVVNINDVILMNNLIIGS
tara:strand:- start:416 stop:1228 length:813 start_codon:yes stop_codon:yes gene_type:complete